MAVDRVAPAIHEGHKLDHGMAALGQGFADLGWYISRSIMFLSFALIVRSAVDFGYMYILILLGMAMLLVLLLWNLHLQTSLAFQRRSRQQADKDEETLKAALKQSRELEEQLNKSREVIHELRLQQALDESRFKQLQDQHGRKVDELEETRILLGKMSGELTRVQSSEHPGDNTQTLLLVQRDAELKQAHDDLKWLKQELSTARFTLSSLEGPSAERTKRRRSV